MLETNKEKMVRDTFYSFGKKETKQYVPPEQVDDAEVLDGLVYYCQRSRMNVVSRDRYLSYLKEAKKRFLKI